MTQADRKIYHVFGLEKSILLIKMTKLPKGLYRFNAISVK